jgi:hypothetical protein
MISPKAEAVATAARIGAPNIDRIGTPTVPPPIPIMALTDPMKMPSAVARRAGGEAVGAAASRPR